MRTAQPEPKVTGSYKKFKKSVCNNNIYNLYNGFLYYIGIYFYKSSSILQAFGRQ